MPELAKKVLKFWVCAGSYSSTDDRLYTHEAAGILAGGEDNTEEQQLSYLSTLMQPLLAQIEQYLPLIGSATQGLAVQNGRPPPDPVGMVLQVNLAIKSKFLGHFLYHPFFRVLHGKIRVPVHWNDYWCMTKDGLMYSGLNELFQFGTSLCHSYCTRFSDPVTHMVHPWESRLVSPLFSMCFSCSLKIWSVYASKFPLNFIFYSTELALKITLLICRLNVLFSFTGTWGLESFDKRLNTPNLYCETPCCGQKLGQSSPCLTQNSTSNPCPLYILYPLTVLQVFIYIETDDLRATKCHLGVPGNV